MHAAMAQPQVGHLDPSFLAMMEDLKGALRYVWQVSSAPGTGIARHTAVTARQARPLRAWEP